MIYSYSRLKCFRNCPLSFRFQYVDKVKVEYFESVEAFMGSRVHEALDLLHMELSKGRVPELAALEDFYLKRWESQVRPDIVINKKDLTFDDYRAEGLKCIGNYYKRYQPFGLSRTVGCEMKVLTDLLGDGRYKFIGYIDRLDKREGEGVYEIHDYKTSRKMPSTGSGDWDWQLALYELGIRQERKDVSDVDLIWHYLKLDREIAMRKTPEQLDVMKSGILGVVKDIEKATESYDFPRTESGLCGWCAFQEQCAGEKKKNAPNDMRLRRVCQSRLGSFV